MSGYRPLRSGISTAEKGAASGLATLDANEWVVQPPAHMRVMKPVAGLALPVVTGTYDATSDPAWVEGAAVFAPNFNPYPCSIEFGVIRIGAPVAEAVVNIGIYDIGADGLPGALLRDAGTVSAATGGIRTFQFASIDLLNGGAYVSIAWPTGGPDLSALRIAGWTAASAAFPRLLTTYSVTQLFTVGRGQSLYAASGYGGAPPDPATNVVTGVDRDVPAAFLRVTAAL